MLFRSDLEFLTWMVGIGRAFILIFTKIDKLSKSAVKKNIEAFLIRMREITQEEPAYVLSSTKESQGRSDILDLIDSAIAENR